MNLKQKSPCIALGALWGAVSGFLIGSFGPLLISPVADVGRLLGPFVTAPLGLLGGAISGYVYWTLGKKPRRPSVCPNCLCDLRGNATGVCPECGMQWAPPNA